ncbi:MAG: phage tail tape measure protein [Rhizobiaceae bacterium]|nr:phage tail tape measure protein [Rhizobiaceae bacterium]
MDPLKREALEAQKQLEQLKKTAETFGKEFTSTIQNSIANGKSFQDTLKAIGLQLSNLALQAALKPLQNSVGAAFGKLFGDLVSTGGSSDGGNVTPMAKGGVVASPTFFASSGGPGVMGEAGPEAVLPLARGSDGRLGVKASSGAGSSAPVNVTFNISTPDVQGFRRSEAQISTMLARAVHRGRRHL